MNKRGLITTAGFLGVTALVLAAVPVMRGSGLDPSIAGQTASYVQGNHNHELELADGVSVRSWVYLSPELWTAERKPVRVIVLTHEFWFEGESIAQMYLHRLVDPDGSQSIDGTGSVFPATANPALEGTMPGRVYEVRTLPLQGHAWRHVAGFGELDVQISERQ